LIHGTVAHACAWLGTADSRRSHRARLMKSQQAAVAAFNSHAMQNMNDTEWPPETFELVRGPQDGAKVKRIGEAMPEEIYVGRQWQGDGFAAWGLSKSARFPCRYVLDGFKFKFRSQQG
jgi:hypothetical protein